MSDATRNRLTLEEWHRMGPSVLSHADPWCPECGPQPEAEWNGERWEPSFLCPECGFCFDLPMEHD